MACRVCGSQGHNSKTCPNKTDPMMEPRDRALIFRADRLTPTEQQALHDGLVKLKKGVTSEEVKATIVEGKSKELPSKIQKLIGKNDS